MLRSRSTVVGSPVGPRLPPPLSGKGPAPRWPRQRFRACRRIGRWTARSGIRLASERDRGADRPASPPTARPSPTWDRRHTGDRSVGQCFRNQHRPDSQTGNDVGAQPPWPITRQGVETNHRGDAAPAPVPGITRRRSLCRAQQPPSPAARSPSRCGCCPATIAAHYPTARAGVRPQPDSRRPRPPHSPLRSR